MEVFKKAKGKTPKLKNRKVENFLQHINKKKEMKKTRELGQKLIFNKEKSEKKLFISTSYKVHQLRSLPSWETVKQNLLMQKFLHAVEFERINIINRQLFKRLCQLKKTQ